MPISPVIWQRLSGAVFEELALEHVRDIYPEFTWRSTSLSADGGKDAIGELRNLEHELSEIYWMEAKNYPTRRSIGKYTLDTHLVSTFFSRGVRRLHVVTSGGLSESFVIRASAFSRDHGFTFAFTDSESLEVWLRTRIDLIHLYFGDDIQQTIEEIGAVDHGAVVARALLVTDNDTLDLASVGASCLLPGRKFRLVVMLSLTGRLARPRAHLQLSWSPPPDRASLLTPTAENSCCLKLDPRQESVISVPFRLLRYGRDPLPAPSLTFSDGADSIVVKMRGSTDLPRLASPLVGKHARESLLMLSRLLREDVAQGRPRLVVCRGRAGAGKTRLCEEVRDHAQRLGFTVRLLEMSSTSRAQEDRWCRLFRWLLGLEQNPFHLSEGWLLDQQLAKLEVTADLASLSQALKAFLLEGVFKDELFNLDLPIGRNLLEVIRSLLGRRISSPLLIHIDDVHHLSRPQMRPLYLLRHLMETVDGLPLCLLLSCRNDETVRDSSFGHFVSGLDLAAFHAFKIVDVPDLDLDDARELVATTMRWPELLAEESRTLEMLIARAGVNPFVLMQTLDHLAIDRDTVAFGYGPSGFLVDPAAFKDALREMPTGVAQILDQRFAGLVTHRETHLLEILAAAAVVGRRAPRRVVSMGLRSRITSRDVSCLLRYGYLQDASATDFELAHDLLREALQRRPEAKAAAARIASALRTKRGKSISPEQEARIYFAAGPRYYGRCWATTVDLAEQWYARQQYVGLPALLERLEGIAASSKKHNFDLRLHWLAAAADQHTGNTYNALQRFRNLQVRSKLSLPATAALYLDSTVEIGNQHLLRCEPTAACASLGAALTLLSDSTVPLTAEEQARITALAHNRYGATLHLLGLHDLARQHLIMALQFAGAAGDEYLSSHTHWNLAALHRFNDTEICQRHLSEARSIWQRGLREKERLRLLLDCSEAYSDCLAVASAPCRWRLWAVAAEASEKGYLFQASGALLCYACCALFDSNWVEAKRALLRVLDLSVMAEDTKHHVFATNYLTICAQMLGSVTESRDWAHQTVGSLVDPGMANTTLNRVAIRNCAVLLGAEPPVIVEGQPQAGELQWAPYDRA